MPSNNSFLNEVVVALLNWNVQVAGTFRKVHLSETELTAAERIAYAVCIAAIDVGNGSSQTRFSDLLFHAGTSTLSHLQLTAVDLRWSDIAQNPAVIQSSAWRYRLEACFVWDASLADKAFETILSLDLHSPEQKLRLGLVIAVLTKKAGLAVTAQSRTLAANAVLADQLGKLSAQERKQLTQLARNCLPEDASTRRLMQKRAKKVGS